MWKNVHTNNQLFKSPGSNWCPQTNFHCIITLSPWSKHGPCRLMQSHKTAHALDSNLPQPKMSCISNWRAAKEGLLCPPFVTGHWPLWLITQGNTHPYLFVGRYVKRIQVTGWWVDTQVWSSRAPSAEPSISVKTRVLPSREPGPRHFAKLLHFEWWQFPGRQQSGLQN